MSKTIKLGLAVFAAFIIIAGLVTISIKNDYLSGTPAVSSEAAATNYKNASSASTSAPAVQPSGDAAIDRDAAAIDANMSAASVDTANADKGLNDKSVPQQ